MWAHDLRPQAGDHDGPGLCYLPILKGGPPVAAAGWLTSFNILLCIYFITCCDSGSRVVAPMHGALRPVSIVIGVPLTTFCYFIYLSLWRVLQMTETTSPGQSTRLGRCLPSKVSSLPGGRLQCWTKSPSAGSQCQMRCRVPFSLQSPVLTCHTRTRKMEDETWVYQNSSHLNLPLLLEWASVSDALQSTLFPPDTCSHLPHTHEKDGGRNLGVPEFIALELATIA